MCKCEIVKDRTVLSSERAPHVNKPVTVKQKKKSGLKSQMGAWHQDGLAN
jgi:hypothetical protein